MIETRAHCCTLSGRNLGTPLPRYNRHVLLQTSARPPLRSTADQRYRLFLSSAWKPRANFYHDYAGRLIRWCQRQNVDVRNVEQLKGILPDLWDRDLTAAIGQPLSGR